MSEKMEKVLTVSKIEQILIENSEVIELKNEVFITVVTAKKFINVAEDIVMSIV